MPVYAWLLESKAEIDAIPQRMRGMRMLGVPYTDQQIENCIEDAQKQAGEIVAKIKEYESPGDLRDKKVIALIAYLDKLGRDIAEPAPAATAERLQQAPGEDPMTVETLQSIADPLRTGLMVAALVAFAAIVAWTFLRPRERIEADAQLWKDDEK